MCKCTVQHGEQSIRDKRIYILNSPRSQFLPSVPRAHSAAAQIKVPFLLCCAVSDVSNVLCKGTLINYVTVFLEDLPLCLPFMILSYFEAPSFSYEINLVGRWTLIAYFRFRPFRLTLDIVFFQYFY